MSDQRVTVIVTDEDGSEAYRATHTAHTHTAQTSASYGRVSVTFSPEMPAVTNGQTLRVEYGDLAIIEGRG